MTAKAYGEAVLIMSTVGRLIKETESERAVPCNKPWKVALAQQ
jgi:hypothetical protein